MKNSLVHILVFKNGYISILNLISVKLFHYPFINICIVHEREDVRKRKSLMCLGPSHHGRYNEERGILIEPCMANKKYLHLS